MEQEATDAATVGRIRAIVHSGWLNTSMLQGTTAVVLVGTHGFIHLLFAQILFLVVPIELEWQQIKNYEISGQMFDDESDLAYAVIDGVEAFLRKGKLHHTKF